MAKRSVVCAEKLATAPEPGEAMFPFVREAVQRGYVVITPDYRGSAGYGDAFYKMIDYGTGKSTTCFRPSTTCRR